MGRMLVRTWLLVLVGCATTPEPRQFDRQIVVDADFATVWDALVEMFGERVWVIDNLDRESGIVTTDWMLANDEAHSYMDCGSGFFDSDRDHVFRFNVILRESGSETSVTVNSAHRTTRYPLGEEPGELVTCVSTGVLERMIHEDLRERVGAGR